MQKLSKILVLADWFEPGYKGGGIIRSCSNFVQQMKNDYAIYILTTDRDLDATTPYENIRHNEWLQYDRDIQIFYYSPQLLSWKHILQQINTIAPDFIYLNSMFSKYFTIYPLLMNRRKKINGKIILAPRGMLKTSALRFKKEKKKFFLFMFKWMKLYKRIHFQATDKTEWKDIQKHFGSNIELSLVPDSAGVVKEYTGSINKREGQLSLIFIGRIHPIKNLDYLLTLLPQVKGSVLLTIVGNEEDADFANRCKNIIASYPHNIKVQFTGEIPNHQVPALLAGHHIFTLPTRGENFGHAIFEALVAGKPVLISDQTPWRNLVAAKAGWDINLQQPGEFVAALQQAIDCNQTQYDEWSHGAWNFVHDFAERSDLKQAYYKLFS